MNTYNVTNARKKGITEIIELTHSDHPDLVLTVENVYSTGEWEVTPQNDEELARLKKCVATEAEFNPNDFAHADNIELFDIEYTDAEFSGAGSDDAEDLFDELNMETDFDIYELTELGWDEGLPTVTVSSIRI